MTQNNSQGERQGGFAAARLISTLVFGIVLPATVLVAGYFGAKHLMASAPRAKRDGGAKGEASARLVEVMPLQRADRQVIIEAMGLVTPARLVTLQPRVNGEIVEQSENLEPGGIFRAGAPMLKIDPADYELTVKMRQAEYRQMESDYKIEMGQQEVARGEFALLGQEIPEGQTGLVLREPQLAKAAADIEAAEAMLEDAQLDLKRTVVASPFNGMVIEESVEIGAIASTSTVLAQMVGTDRFWIELTVPLDELRWINIPTPGDTAAGDALTGSMVRIYDDAAWGPDDYRMGRIVRFTSSVDPQSRMARLLVGVDDPLALTAENKGAPQLLLNSYVRAEIEGKIIPDTYAIPREVVRDGRHIWVMSPENRLEVHELDVEWRGSDEIYVKQDFRPDDLLITSTLKTPVEGMLLRTRGSELLKTNEMNALVAPVTQQ